MRYLEERGIEVMKSLRQIIFMFAVVIGMALSVSAQTDDQNKPRKDPPVIKPGEKPRRDNPPKGDDKPKKPGMSFFLVSVKRDGNIG